MKHFLLLALALLFVMPSIARSAKVDKAKWNGDKVPCATITVKGDRKTVMKNLKDVLKDEDLKVKGNAKKLKAPAVNWERVSKNLMNVYATSKKESSDETTVNVRKSDSEKSEKIGKVAGGTKVQVLETLVNGWTKISYENSEGYIMSKFLKVQESAQKYTIIGKVKATDNINVRAESSTDSAKMGTLVSGDTADLIAEEGDWCKISFNGQVAYVKTEYVQKQ